IYTPSCSANGCEMLRYRIPEIQLNGTLYESANLVDIEGDGDLDLLASIGPGRTAIARGEPNGGIATSAIEDARFGDLADRWPIAAGDIDGDGLADFVTPNRVYLATGTSTAPYRKVIESVETFSAAAIADFDGNGEVDVATVLAQRSEIEVRYRHDD